MKKEAFCALSEFLTLSCPRVISALQFVFVPASVGQLFLLSGFDLLGGLLWPKLPPCSLTFSYRWLMGNGGYTGSYRVVCAVSLQLINTMPNSGKNDEQI